MTDRLYQFVSDEGQMRLFYQKHIMPFHEQNDLSYIILPTARRKYHPELGKSQMVTNTTTFSSLKTEDQFVERMRRYEIRDGTYKDQRTNESLPASAFAMYITVDPMNELRAFFKLQAEIGTRLEVRLRNQETNSSPLKIESVYKSELHKCSENIFKKLDVDTKDPEKIEELRKILEENKIRMHLVIETKNGFHVLINTKNGDIDTEGNKALYQFVSQAEVKSWITVEKNAMVVIPGTFQAGFPVRIVNWTGY